MILLIFATISGMAIIAGTAVLALIAAFRPEGFEPTPIDRRLAKALPSGSRTADDSRYQLRQHDWTVEYDDPVGAQRIVLTQNPESFGEEAALETARTIAMLHRETTVEVWSEHRTTRERSMVDAIRMESRRVA